MSRKYQPNSTTNTFPLPSVDNMTLAYDFIFRSTSDGILLTNPEGVIEQMNPAGAAMLSIPVEEIIGRTPEQCLRHNPALLNLFARPGGQTLDIRLPKRRLAVGVATTLASGERMVILHDVTEKQDLDSRRVALAHTIAHDLRNPIAAIGGYADLVGKFGGLNEQQDKFLGRIRQTTAKLHEVVESLVDLAWIEAGMPLAHRPIEMGAVINKAVHQLTALAVAHKITIAISLQDPLPPLMGDPERMELAIYQILHNAIMYSHPEQTIAIHAWGDLNECYCSVADRGIGIADEEIPLIFDRMYRSKDERVRDIPGGGLGLTMARTIISRHGGDIWAASNLDVGSTFTFVLPAVQPETISYAASQD
ncbi:MAG: PAS domain-containing protein [Anaerolineaceae bacterium]|nr:PAS domain-containing protein [Anaerolineaceae bacterium]